MALMKSKEIPEDAVVLDEVEATTYIWDLVDKWNSISDVWALRYGPSVLGGVNAFAGILINRHYRNKLKLGTYGFYSSVIPITLMPGLMTTLFHRHLITSDMLLMKRDMCPICYEVRSAAIQLSFGIAYPMVLGPTAALMFANRYSTFRIPDLTDGPKVVFQFLRNITKRFHNTLVTLTVFQLVASSFITYLEIRNNFTFRRKLTEIEKDFDNAEDVN
ncbi:uncharacterized protein LOC113512782 [Galleria mellonella]|uniref:Uncharacterized protein LOC113512782 n=1 Tax=Galleria mellonella TaxID=7137 RepID=A0A6J1WF80_GALME|nr:uncharacterized protein LOC113512782 [Galleria mellonella]